MLCRASSFPWSDLEEDRAVSEEARLTALAVAEAESAAAESALPDDVSRALVEWMAHAEASAPPLPVEEENEGEAAAAAATTTTTTASESEGERARPEHVEAEQVQVGRLLGELVATEASYVADLKAMVSVYAKPVGMMSVMSDAERRAIFGKIEPIVACNSALLEALRGAQVDDSGGSNSGGGGGGGGSERIRRVADAFLRVGPYLVLYQEYCRNYQTALSTLEACVARSAELRDCLETLRLNNSRCRGLPLSFFLIMPVQRLLKYPLFLADLLKTIGEGHADAAAVARADALLRAVAGRVNAALSDGAARMQSLWQSLVPDGHGEEWTTCLMSRHRRLTYDFSCHLASALDGAACSFPASGYVLTDCLLLCGVQQQGSAANGGGGGGGGRRGGGSAAQRLWPWLLLPLEELLWDEEAVDGDRGQAALAPLLAPSTAWHLLLRGTSLEGECLRVEMRGEEDVRALSVALSAALADMDKAVATRRGQLAVAEDDEGVLHQLAESLTAARNVALSHALGSSKASSAAAAARLSRWGSSAPVGADARSSQGGGNSSRHSSVAGLRESMRLSQSSLGDDRGSGRCGESSPRARVTSAAAAAAAATAATTARAVGGRVASAMRDLRSAPAGKRGSATGHADAAGPEPEPAEPSQGQQLYFERLTDYLNTAAVPREPESARRGSLR